MKKGFTLIELLAVIVILAVIALIAIPIVMDIINDSKKEAAKRSVDGYVRAINYKIADLMLHNEEEIDGDYVIGENALELDGNNLTGIAGGYTINNNRVLWAGLCVDGYSIEYNATTGHTGLSQTNYCTGGSTFVFEEPEAESMSIACTDSSKYTSETYFKIKTVEDLACLSNLVNSGKNFSGKTIYLLADIDIESDSSYSNPSTTAYGDINGNGTTEGLKVELTTGAGFRPIGNNSTKFSGTFDGYAFTIDHLMINRNTQYVGMFGYNNGTISGFKLKNLSLTSSYSNTNDAQIGGVVGKNEGTLKNIDVQGTITASSATCIGGVVGRNDNLTTGILFKGSVTGKSFVGGIAGYQSGGTLKSVVYDSTITATQYAGKIAGTGSINQSYTYNTTKNASDGPDGISLLYVSLEAVDGSLDTYIGGDNDSDGYYFDYDSEGNVALFATARNPIETNKLKGEGTEESPYLIRNEKDWKIASATVTQSKYYSVTSDIDYINKKFYVLGTYENKFNGHINGNMHTVSNVSITGYNYAGMFGYNNGGSIEGFIFNGITLSSTGQFVGSVAGHSTGTINGIRLNNISVTSTFLDNSKDAHIGGVVGTNEGPLKNIDMKGNVTANSAMCIGGVVGRNSSQALGIVFKGRVTGNKVIGGAVGYQSEGTLKSVVYDSTVTSSQYSGKITGLGSTGLTGYNYNTTSNATSGDNGIAISAFTLEAVDGALDTYIGGDNDSDGYYFDYDSSGNITVFSIALNPMTNTLAGLGTEASPYLISSAADWKVASTLGNKSKYFRVTSNIDFASSNFYALGTNENKFNGNINGNMHTISNISIAGYNYVGLFGYNNGGTIEGFVFDNVAASATGKFVGGIVGHNTGTVNGIKARNINVTSTFGQSQDAHIGGVMGVNAGTLKNIDARGTVTASLTNCVGGIAGKNESQALGLIFNGTVTGKSVIGGVVGYQSSGTLKSVVYGTTITATQYGGKLTGLGSYGLSGYNYNTTVSVSGGEHGTTLSTLTLEGVSSVLDINDSDSDGYYFTLTNNELELVKTN